MITITTTLIMNVIDYDYDSILSNRDYSHDYNVYDTNDNVVLHLYSLSYIYNTDITTKKYRTFIEVDFIDLVM